MTLEAVLRSRARERSIWRSSGAVVLCLFFLGLYAGYEGFVYRTALTAESARCWHGDLEACIEQGDRYEKGRGVAKDRERARALFRRACDRASVEGCFRRAAAEQVLSDDADDRLAADLYRKACDGGHAEACRKLKNR